MEKKETSNRRENVNAGADGSHENRFHGERIEVTVRDQVSNGPRIGPRYEAAHVRVVFDSIDDYNKHIDMLCSQRVVQVLKTVKDMTAPIDGVYHYIEELIKDESDRDN